MKPQLTLGEFIKKLSNCDAEHEVLFDFGNLRPTFLDSYRGHYNHLAIGYELTTPVSVKDLLARARESLNDTFYGYKGGDYMMTEDTPLWVANYGQCTSTQIIDVVDLGWVVVIQTRHEDTPNA